MSIRFAGLICCVDAQAIASTKGPGRSSSDESARAAPFSWGCSPSRTSGPSYVLSDKVASTLIYACRVPCPGMIATATCSRIGDGRQLGDAVRGSGIPPGYGAGRIHARVQDTPPGSEGPLHLGADDIDVGIVLPDQRMAKGIAAFDPRILHEQMGIGEIELQSGCRPIAGTDA